MPHRVVLVTGISGTDAQSAMDALAARHPERVRLHNVGKIMEQCATESRLPYSASNILNAPRDTLTALRGAAIERILRVTDSAASPEPVIDVVFCHATFLLKTGLREGFSLSDLQRLRPDLLVTLIDAPQDIHDRLTRHPGDYLHLTIESIVKWQEFEVYVSNIFSHVAEKRHFVVPQRQSETLESLLLHDRTPVYVSYPMTHLPPELRPKVRDFVDFLRERFTVFDPAAVESTHNLKPFYSRLDLHAINDHTVVRDLDWLIGINSDWVIAYMPKIVFSSGMNDELRYGFEVGKETFIVLDELFRDGIPDLSPFTMYKSKVFFSRADFAFFLDLSPELRDAYQWISSQLHESMRLARTMQGQLTFSTFLRECDALCRYHLAAPHYERIQGEIAEMARRVFQAWHPDAAETT